MITVGIGGAFDIRRHDGTTKDIAYCHVQAPGSA